MPNLLSFVRGTTYTFRIYNRVFAEQTFLITTTAVGESFDDIVTLGVTYNYRKVNGSVYDGLVNYRHDGKVYTGATYTDADSELLDIVEVSFTPEAGHADTLYIQSANDANMGTPIYILNALGDIINPEQVYYMLGIGRLPALADLSFDETFLDKYISDVLPAGVEGHKFTI